MKNLNKKSIFFFIIIIFISCGFKYELKNKDKNINENQIIITKIVNRHNYYRRLVFTDSNLKWDVNLAKHAKEWANYLATNYTIADKQAGKSPHASKFHKNFHNLSYQNEGENIAWSNFNRGYTTKNPVDLTVENSGENGSIDAWANEKKYYDYKNNRKINSNKQIGHYTQLVWQETTKIGCGKANSTTDQGGEHVVCRYSRAGNIIGEKPYCSNYTLSNLYTNNNLKFTQNMINNKTFHIIKILEDRRNCIRTDFQEAKPMIFKGLHSLEILSFDAFNKGNSSNQWTINFDKIVIKNGILQLSEINGNKIMKLKLIGESRRFYNVEAEWNMDKTNDLYKRKAILKLLK